jgi:AcrR family transcriptional regulator
MNIPYHHGHLREALVESALATARLEGPDAVILRAVTRDAGVSPNAAYRHFADRDQLIEVIASRCRENLAELIETRLAEMSVGSDPVVTAWERLRVAGRAYVEFAVTEPGWFRTAFGFSRSTELPTASSQRNPFTLLNNTLDELVAVGALSVERRAGAEYAAWSGVHGIATLLVDGPLRGLPSAERAPIVSKVIDVIVAGL